MAKQNLIPSTPCVIPIVPPEMIPKHITRSKPRSLSGVASKNAKVGGYNRNAESSLAKDIFSEDRLGGDMVAEVDEIIQQLK